MPDFIFKYNKSAGSMPRNKTYKIIQKGENVCLAIKKDTDYLEWETQTCRYFVIGDLVSSINSRLNWDIGSFLKTYPGNYYFIKEEKDKCVWQIASNLFNIMPVFYYDGGNQFIFSGNLKAIEEEMDFKPQFDKRFLLESFLFNYSLFDTTYFKEIKLLPSLSFATIAPRTNIQFTRYMEVPELFPESPAKHKNSLSGLTDHFKQRTKVYFPDKPFALSFTGGFDGRTLMAMALQEKADFQAFAFGTSDNPDLFLPQETSSRLGIPFSAYHLDDPVYYRQAYLETGKELIRETGMMAGLIYVHFLYSAKKLGADFQVLINGFFGSELFRALHVTGAMTSSELYHVFACPDKDQWIEKIKSSPKLAYIEKHAFKNEMEELIDDLSTFKRRMSSGLTQNQLFYCFVFEEIFRKFFGPLVKAQSNYIHVRTPFLDYSFIKDLLSTDLAGVHNDFFTHNPLKRFRGQIFYAKVIAQTYPRLLKEMTGKGYKPVDLLYKYRIANIAIPYFRKKNPWQRKKVNLDNLAILRSLNEHFYSSDHLINNPLLNSNELKKLSADFFVLNETQRDLIARAYSFSLAEALL